ncbi:MAG: T9SS type A sorting domain-containing protein [Flavobacteriales bacterium]
MYVSSIGILNDGKILVSGNVSFTGSSLEYGSARLNPDGSRDLSFPPFPQSIGAGKLTSWQDRFYVGTAQLVRRLTPSGLIDASFHDLNDNAPSFSSGQGGDYHVYPDGSVVITGYHIVNVPDSGWQNIYCLIWFNNDGTLDLTRQPRYGNGTINLIVPQPDGKFLLSGSCTTWEGVPTPNIFRVHANGTLDTSFNCAIGWGEAASITVLEDERILVSGLFKTSFSSPDTLHFVRLMPDGSLDPTFNNDLEVVRMPWLASEWPGNTINWGQFTIPRHTRLTDGRIALHGSHWWVEGQERFGIAMLDADGNLLDEPFAGGGCGRYYNAGTGYLYGNIDGIIEAPDGFLYIWGGYKGYDDGTTNDPTQRFVSRLYGLNVGVREQEQPGMRVYPNPASANVIVELERVSVRSELVLRDALGRTVLRQRVSGTNASFSIQHLSDGIYGMQLLVGNAPVASQKLVIQH